MENSILKVVLFKKCDETLHMIKSVLLKRKNIVIEAICDRDTKLWGRTCENLPIISPFELIKKYKNGDIEKVILPGATLSELERRKAFFVMNGLGIKEEDILFGTIELLNEDENGILLQSWREYSAMDYLELHTNDHCNLKCSNCNNFSNLVEGERFYDFGIFERDTERLKELVNHISVIRILGGEPLLNKETYKFVKKMRDLYPYAEIHLVTNGILLLKMPDVLCEALIETNTIVDITAYPGFYDKMDERIAFLNERKIRHNNPFIASKFFPPIIERYEYPFSYVDCMCVNLRDGYLTRCPMQQYIADYNKANGTDFDEYDGKINIYKEQSFESLLEKLHKPFELCNYCGMYRQNELWENWKK